MKQIPSPLPKKAAQLLSYVEKMRIPVYASHASFFIALAVFPSLMLLLSLLRYTGLEITALTEVLEGVIPRALLPAAQRLIINTYRNTTGTVVSISAVLALWSASRGVHGVCTGLNSVYGVEEDRGFLRPRLLSVLYTFAFLLVLLLTLVLHVFGKSLLRWLPLEESAILRFLEEIVGLRFLLLLAVQTAVFTAMFMMLPNHRNRLADSLPGALFSSVGWLIFSELYSVYVERFATLSNIYGSVYAVALSMLWLYCCMSIVFYGGVLNRYLMDRKQDPPQAQ